jgi:ubiquitin-protein ligase
MQFKGCFNSIESPNITMAATKRIKKEFRDLEKFAINSPNDTNSSHLELIYMSNPHDLTQIQIEEGKERINLLCDYFPVVIGQIIESYQCHTIPFKVFLNKSFGSELDLPLEPNKEIEWKNNYFLGPKGTLYEGGKFKFTVTFPPKYPFYPVRIDINTKIYHPLIAERSEQVYHPCYLKVGCFCTEGWNASYTLHTVLQHLADLISFEPELSKDYVGLHEAEKLFKENRELYNETVTKWTKLYAM